MTIDYEKFYERLSLLEEKRSRTKLYILIGAALLPIISIWITIMAFRTDIKTEATPIKITSIELAREFETNTVAATLKYNNKKLDVWGMIIDFYVQRRLDRVIVILEGYDGKNVHMMFSEEYAVDISKKSKGELFQGYCELDEDYSSLYLSCTW